MKNLPYKQKTELRIKARFFYESYLYLMSNIERRRMNEEVGNRAILGTLYFVLSTFLMSNVQLRWMNEEEGLKSQQWTVDCQLLAKTYSHSIVAGGLEEMS